MIRFLMMANLILALLLAGCGGGTNTGGGTETGDPGDMNSPEFSGGVISGKVALDEEETISLEGARIWLDGDSRLLKKSDTGGDYLIEGLSAGNHELFVSWTSEDVVLMGKSEVFFIGESSALEKPRIYLGQTIVVGAPSAIQGFVQSPKDSKVTLKLKNSIFKSEALVNTGFELNDIPFGEYTLEVYQNKKLKFSEEIKLIAGEILDLGIISIK